MMAVALGVFALVVLLVEYQVWSNARALNDHLKTCHPPGAAAEPHTSGRYLEREE